jgi:hypothetical protein
MSIKWVISFAVMGVICALVLNFFLVMMLTFIGLRLRLNTQHLVEVANDASWLLGFLVSYRLWPPKPRAASTGNSTEHDVES